MEATERPAHVDTVHEIEPASATYREILRSSVLVGGSSAINLFVGIVRAKALAILLGPSGVGLTGLYSSIVDVAQNLAGLGVNSSGVRQIAEAASTGDSMRIARTAAVLKQTSLLLGICGAAGLLILATDISRITFGTTQQTHLIGLLSIAVLFRLVSSGQAALIQGMRRIGDLARMNVASAILGATSSIALVCVYGVQGVVPSLVVAAGMTILTSWWFSRKIPVCAIRVEKSQISLEAGALLKLGFAFMVSGLATVGASYVVRVIVLRNAGVEGAGLYQSAWSLGGMYVGFILQAMGADFYPRICAGAHDDRLCNRLTQEQTRVGVLLAGPGVSATITSAAIIIGIFYSAKFGGAVEILRWICLGAFVQVISWPMGFILIAKGNQNLFLLSDLAWTAVYLSLAVWLVGRFGAAGAGMAFFGSYLFHAALTYSIARHLSGFRLSGENGKVILLFASGITAVFVGFYLLTVLAAVCLGLVLTGCLCGYAVRQIVKLGLSDSLPGPFRRLIYGFCPSR